MKRRVQLVHWNAAEAAERSKLLAGAGYEVGVEPASPRLFRELRDRPPDAFVIDLSRGPSRGRDVALGLRAQRGTKAVPIVFAGGDPEKVARVKALLPDAVYASWRGVRGAVARAIAHPPPAYGKPRSRLAGYAGTPLPNKLGIKPGTDVLLVGGPQDFDRILDKLPEGARVRRRGRGGADLVMWFVRYRRALERDVVEMAARLGRGAMWIVWPKRGSEVPGDLSQQLVRKAGLAAGLVDYKIGALDRTWSGLKFTRRKK